MNALLRTPMAMLWICACIAGCATQGEMSRTLSRSTPVSTLSAKEAIAPGRSTREDVIAALGKTTVVSFDSGFEVWVYRVTDAKSPSDAAGNSEFVVLFAPSGVVAKTRTRVAPPVVEARGR